MQWWQNSSQSRYLFVIVVIRAKMRLKLGSQLILFVAELAIEDAVYLFHFILDFGLALSNNLWRTQRAGNGHPGNTAHHTLTREPEPSPLSKYFATKTLSCSL